jgi:transposase
MQAPVRGPDHQGAQAMKPKPKRPVAKMFVVSDDTHKRLKEYAKRKGYKLQYVADEAVSEYLEGKETK